MFPQIPICLHQDHGNSRATCVSAMPGRVYLGDDGWLARSRRQHAGELRLQPGAITSEVTRIAHDIGVSVEGELGCLRLAGNRRGRQGRRPRLRGQPPSAAPIADRSRAGGRFRHPHAASTRWAIAMGTSHGGLQVQPPARRRHPGDGRGAGDQQQSCPRCTWSCTVRRRCRSSYRTSSNEFGGRNAADLGRPGRRNRARHPATACARSTSTTIAAWR